MSPYPSHEDSWPGDPWAETVDDPEADTEQVTDEITYTLGRTPGRTYVSKSFDIQ